MIKDLETSNFQMCSITLFRGDKIWTWAAAQGRSYCTMAFPSVLSANDFLAARQYSQRPFRESGFVVGKRSPRKRLRGQRNLGMSEHVQRIKERAGIQKSLLLADRAPLYGARATRGTHYSSCAFALLCFGPSALLF